MKFCSTCESGEKRQFSKHCFECGDKLIDVPVKDCVCGNKPKSHNAFCIKCGNKLEIKKLEQKVVV